MVDKIDRPEAPAPWVIKQADRAKDDRPSQQQQETAEHKKEKFEKKAQEGRWQKFDSRTMIMKPMRVALKDIKGFRFRGVTIHGGVATMEGDLEWTHGRTTENTLVHVGGFEEYLHLKRLKPGVEVPREFWSKSDPLDVGIPQERSPSGSFVMAELEREETTAHRATDTLRTSRLAALGLIDAITGKFQWPTLILYLIIATGLALGLHALLTMTRT